jgi:hypothetical protein
MHIYQAGKKIEEKEFRNDFSIIRIDNDLFWGEDSELHSRNLSGEVLIWFRRMSYVPELAFVLPEWKLILDGIEISDPGILINIEGKTAELQYKDYRFVCNIPKVKYKPGSKTARLRAMLGRDTE